MKWVSIFFSPFVFSSDIYRIGACYILFRRRLGARKTADIYLRNHN